MTTSITSPATQAQGLAAGVQYSYRLAELVALALMDQADVTDVMGDPVDLSGLGSTSMRLPFINTVGYSKRMTASGGETTLNAASAYDVGYSTASVAQYDLSYTQSAQNRVIGLQGATVTLEMLADMVVANYIATNRYLFAVAGSGISYATVGSTSLELNSDDLFNIAYKSRLRLGAQALGIPVATVTPASFNSAVNSLRSEPGFTFNLDALRGAARYTGMQRLSDPFGLGYDVVLTSDVQTSGGADLGFAVSPGAIRRVKADPTRIALPAAVNPVYLPDLGIVVYDLVQALNAATLGKQILGFMGATLSDPLTSIQILVNTKTPS